MEDICGGAKPYLNTALMEAEHRRIKDKALHQFQSKRKMGGDEFSEKYREQLDKVRCCCFYEAFNFKDYNFRTWKTRSCNLGLIMKVKIFSKLPGLLLCSLH